MPYQTRVLIVDDSRIFRGVLEGALAAIPGVEVVGSVWNGEKAMEVLDRLQPNVVTLDLEMPGMDGLATLKAIQARNQLQSDKPPVEVLLVSSHTASGAKATVEALEAGAFDFLTKPEASRLEENKDLLRCSLSCKLRTLDQRRGKPKPIASPPRKHDSGIYRRPRSVRALLIGVSTGGPQALARLLPDLASRVTVPILIVQHMPAGFTHFLAESLCRKCRKCRVTVEEAKNCQLVEPGHIYIAPGQRHLLVKACGPDVYTTLNDQPPENGCRPSVDVLFRSAAVTYGGEAVGIILTGMGADGTLGLGALKRSGAYTIAQDEAGSVVWGMPGSAVAAGVVDEVLPIDKMAKAIESLVATHGR